MPEQRELSLVDPPEEAEISEVEYERRALARIARDADDAVNEIGRKVVCYPLELSESNLSRQLSGADSRVLDFRVVLYSMKRQPSERLARAVMRYAQFAPPERPERLPPDVENSRLRAVLQRHGAFGQHILEEALGPRARKGKP